MLIFHAEEAYLDDVVSLRSYLQSELNIRSIDCTSDEAACGVKYRATVDWPTAGKRFRERVAAVKTLVASLSSDDIKQYLATGTISAPDVVLAPGDLITSRYVELVDPSSFSTSTDGDVIVVLDIRVHQELVGEWLAREFINRVQKLRKKAGLQAVDNASVFYCLPESGGLDLKMALECHEALVERTIRSRPTELHNRAIEGGVIVEEDVEIASVKLHLYLTWA